MQIIAIKFVHLLLKCLSKHNVVCSEFLSKLFLKKIIYLAFGNSKNENVVMFEIFFTSLLWHSSGCSSVTHPAPQISTGNFSHLVSPTNLPCCFSMYLVVQEDSYTVLHCSGPWPLQTFLSGL